MSESTMVSAQRSEGLSRAEAEPSTWEWVIAAVSTILVVGAIGFVFYKAFTGSTAPAKIEIQVEEIVETNDGYVVEFSAFNYGGTTAKGLAIEATLSDGDEVIVTRSVSLDFVPTESSREGGIFFPVDPREYEMELYPVGYDNP